MSYFMTFCDPVFPLRLTTSHRLAVLFMTLLGAVSLARMLCRRKRNPSGLSLPPGPKGLPILGNLLQMPSERHWEVYKEWGKQYGDIIYLEVLGSPILVLNSLAPVVDLLEKAAPIFSDRQYVPAYEMIRVTWNFVTMDYSQRWRDHRRSFHQFFHQREVQKYRPIIEQEVHAFLGRIANNPKALLQETRYCFGGIILRISYGVDDYEYNKSLIAHAELSVKGFSEVTLPGRFLVNQFPIMEHIPSWLPGAGWKRRLEEVTAASEVILAKPFREAKERIRSGQETEFMSVAARLIELLPNEDDPSYASEEELARNTALVAYFAGSDTTVTSTHALFFALATHPEVQRRAQEQIDAIVGKHRLPTPEDCSQLPYVHAIVKEVNRWHTVLPLAIPHVSSQDFEYNGYFIPKGTSVLPNAWAIMHDANTFKDPFEFRPERYLTEDGNLDASVLDPNAGQFGYGRRICPGRHLSNEALTYFVACFLAVFEIKPPKDELGNCLPMEMKVNSDLLCAPEPFDCEVTPRSRAHLALVRDFVPSSN
ncbi:O-methylsterigmatocystin oxidoreductase [Coprinopsis cinerea okayama7|uniref:O-methylsterigmatocystin oxidoreductase n=1 Tax=Coprinopsis cinerea (strain Okayama-7 / 130 / ATCC MYA-4618 / FGSC 9003) TaxID=240176 RepID=A8PAP2_COPC7|nr:O-methylsterigmatocystin oxidoreductase [Coprinopsis cinerea okayama7\|eukprot:XP_001840024.2 O-methylsterigmatocystin oxidoreductase [Coprinopsis cinerea okayama7\